MTSVQIKNTARLRLATAAYPLKKLALVYAGVCLGGSLVTLLISYFLGMLAENTGGLSGMDTRAVLETVVTVTELALQLATPLLAMGFLHSALLTAREGTPGPGTLLVGFRRWALLLRYALLQGLLLFFLGYLALQLGTVVFTFLPGADSAMTLMMSLMEDPAVLEGNVSEAQLLQMLDALAPAYIIAIVLFIAAFIPLSYRLRLAIYRVMEETPTGAVKSTLESFRLMKGSCMALFRLDLSFWWYYLLQALLSCAVAVLALLPQVSDVGYVLGFAAYCLMSLLLEYKCLAYVQTGYAVFYENILSKTNAPVHSQIEQS